MLVVVAMICLLAVMTTPSVGWVRNQAKRISCASQLHGIGQGLATFASAHRFCLPPFAFSDVSGNLPLSGHWGGTEDNDPTMLGRMPPSAAGMKYVNLWALVAENILQPQQLVCPSAGYGLRGNGTSLFPYTTRFSTYCLRFPVSKDLFSSAPSLNKDNTSLGVLGIYLHKAGGQEENVGSSTETVPQVRLDRRYRLDSGVVFGRDFFDPSCDALLADAFWYQGYSADAPTTLKASGYAVSRNWYHAAEFNVLAGCGAVKTVADDNTVAANSNAPGGTLPNTGLYFGKYAEKVWQFFDQAR
jgi:type II secretory pathway pseudopilin PulG